MLPKTILKIVSVLALGYLSVEGNRERSLTSCITQEHNSNNPKIVRLFCTGHEMIHIKRTFMATAEVQLQNAHNWCDFPRYDSNHCKAFEQQLTDEFSAACNTLSVCSLKQYHTELTNCKPDTFDLQIATFNYIHVEYDCLPRYDPLNINRQIEFTQLYPQSTDMHTGSMIYLLSVDYPRMLPLNEKSMCIISLPANTHGSIKILDLKFTSSQQLSCPIRIDVPGKFRCADSETTELARFTLSPNEHHVNLPFYDIHLEITKDPQVEELRVWLQVTALDMRELFASGMRVTCYGQQKQQPDVLSTPSITTTVGIPSASNNGTDGSSQAPTSKVEGGTLYWAIGGCVAVIGGVTVAIGVVFKKWKNSKVQRKPNLAVTSHSNGLEEIVEPYTYTRARFANSQVNEGIQSDYESISKRPEDSACEKEYTRLPPKYENHQGTGTTTPISENDDLNPYLIPVQNLTD